MDTSTLLLASFAADSLSLGAHWIYDTAKIKSEFGRIDALQKPLPDSYHKNKVRGDFTHYGDQALLLLESLAENKKFDLRSFADTWQKYMSAYSGYRDRATAKTLENLGMGMDYESCGSPSTDLGGAARIAPLVYFHQNDREAMHESVRKQTMLTHNSAVVIEAGKILAEVCWHVLHGEKPVEALNTVITNGIDDMDLDMRLRNSLDCLEMPSREAIASFGQACGVAAGLPGVFHLVAKYENDLQSALIENVMAGGDSAARGLCVGMILGAYSRAQFIPADWVESMVQYPQICRLIEKIDGGRQAEN